MILLVSSTFYLLLLLLLLLQTPTRPPAHLPQPASTSWRLHPFPSQSRLISSASTRHWQAGRQHRAQLTSSIHPGIILHRLPAYTPPPPPPPPHPPSQNVSQASVKKKKSRGGEISSFLFGPQRAAKIHLMCRVYIYFPPSPPK